ncbi:MAG: hypothetical protein HY010_11230 [Acidobacteria bacterium]|nr:hypothetical protein [Acidobacteriota bacterium]
MKNDPKTWQSLCEAAIREADSRELLKIISELIETLDAKDNLSHPVEELSRTVAFPRVES